MIVDFEEVLHHISDVNIEDDEVRDTILKIHQGVEKWVKTFCRRDLESASYTEWYDGDGSEYLWLKQYPVTAITRVSVGLIDVISIRNTNDYYYASVNCSPASLVLTINATTSTLLIATYSTMATLVAAINALSANGWSAEIMSSDYNNFPSSSLKSAYGLACVKDQSVYVKMPDWTSIDFIPYLEEGQGYLHREGGWFKGNQNIYVSYAAGYSSATMPADLALAIKEAVQYVYELRQNSSMGIKSWSLEGVSMTYEDSSGGYGTMALPGSIINKLWNYKKVLV